MSSKSALQRQKMKQEHSALQGVPGEAECKQQNEKEKWLNEHVQWLRNESRRKN